MTPEQAIEYFTDIIASYGAPASKTRYIEAAKAALKALKKQENERKVKEEISTLLEDVIDTLVEVGNGVTNEDLHEAADKLFKIRKLWSGDNE
jgi:uncharacterized membrane protein